MALNIEDWSSIVSGDPMMSSSSQLSIQGGRLLNGTSGVPTSTTSTSKAIDPLSEGDLFSQERLDRSSPDLWPEQIPGVTEFVARSQSPLLSTYGSQSLQETSMSSGRIISTGSRTTIAVSEGHSLFPQCDLGQTSSITSIPSSNRHRDSVEWLGLKDPLTSEEMHLIQGFGALNSVSLYEKVRELEDLAYQLGLEESREMSRGTLLSVLQPPGNGGRRRDNIENMNRTIRRSGGRKQKLPTDKRLFFTDSDNPQVSPGSKSDHHLTGSKSDHHLTDSHDHSLLNASNNDIPQLCLIPDLNHDSSSPLRSLRTDPTLMR